MSRFEELIDRYRMEGAGRLPFLSDRPPRSLAELLARIGELSADEWPAVIRFLTELKHRATIPLLLDVMTSRLLLAQDAAHAIATIGGRDACPGLARLLRNDMRRDVRLAAAYGLTWLLDPTALAALCSCFADAAENAEVRVQAAEGLSYLVGLLHRGSTPWRQAATAFMAGLDDAHPEIRRWSAHAAGIMELRSAAPRLRELADEASTGSDTAEILRLREEAGEALALIHEATTTPPARTLKKVA